MRSIATLDFGGTTWGTDLAFLREVIEPLQTTRVPLTPSIIRGVINLRGELTPVLALDDWLRLETPEGSIARRPWMAVFAIPPYRFGVLTDRVGTATFEGELASPVEGQSASIEGYAATEGGSIAVLRIHALTRLLESSVSQTLLSIRPTTEP